MSDQTDGQAKPGQADIADLLHEESSALAWEDMPDANPAAPDGDGRRVTKWDLRKIRTRLMILHAAREVFADRGFNAPRIEDVARAAGVSRAAFYLHFKSPEDLIESVFEREVRWQLRRYRSLSSDIMQNERRIRGWLERFFASFRQERQYYLIINRALSANPASLRIIFHERKRALIHLGRRVPELRLLGPDGAPTPERMIEMQALASRIDEFSLYSAFNAWGAEASLTLDSLVRALADFADVERGAS